MAHAEEGKYISQRKYAFDIIEYTCPLDACYVATSFGKNHQLAFDDVSLLIL